MEKKYFHNIHVLFNVIYPKYSKHLPYTVAHTIDCVCSKMLNHGVNGGDHLIDLFITELKDHMICYQLECSHWWKINL